MVRKMTREHFHNLRSIVDTKKDNASEQGISISNVGTASKYIWESCVVEVKNVLTDEGEFESIKGDKKNALFDSVGIDAEITEAIQYVQSISSFSETEIKN